ncbi:hypothetical protein SO802_009554 [Lithocarpus litseifolius]|uniref:Uncharacterized protein n=1 Tax=Lithocarpus litseifolius TaxID=425828 RepID=A0AAW2DC95_9ROSI
MPFCFKPKYRWLTKLFRLSLPLKLRKTSYFHVAVEGHDDQSFWVLMKAAENIPEIQVLDLEQPLTTEASPADAKIPEGVEAGKEAPPPLRAKSSEDELTIRDAVTQAKVAEDKSKANDAPPKAANPNKDLP